MRGGLEHSWKIFRERKASHCPEVLPEQRRKPTEQGTLWDLLQTSPHLLRTSRSLSYSLSDRISLMESSSARTNHWIAIGIHDPPNTELDSTLRQDCIRQKGFLSYENVFLFCRTLSLAIDPARRGALSRCVASKWQRHAEFWKVED